LIFHSGGTTTIQNGAFLAKPDYPLTKYGNAIYYPCVASIDENTGFLSGINGLNDTWSYSFTEGKYV
jgi:hypothetical protein